MRFRALWGFLLFSALLPVKAAADNRFIVRDPSGLASLQLVCAAQGCTVVRALDGHANQLFLVTTPGVMDPTVFLSALRSIPEIVDAELDQLLSLVGGFNAVTTPPPGLTDSAPVSYFGTTVWNGYANQPASKIVRVQDAQNMFNVAGTGIVADIDTGVDPGHPALQPVLLPGYDFTRDQPGASELNDLNQSDFSSYPPQSCPDCQPAIVNQSSAAILDQSSAAILDGNAQYAAFGHGTMVMGVIHLVAPAAQLLPLKAFKSDGTGYLSDILQAIYYAAQDGANVINMSFDTMTSSQELQNALDYANQNNVICAASTGNDGQGPPILVYPAALQSDVMGVASTSDLDQRSSFSNYGDNIVWVAAPGEAIITTYPFSTYAAGWGTSFSAPFVSGGAALLRNQDPGTDESQAAAAVAHAVPVGPDMGQGRLDLVRALQARDIPPTGSIDSPASNFTIVRAGQSVFFSASGTDPDGTVTGYSWSFPGGNPSSSSIATPGNITYPKPGIFVASLTVTDNAGLSDPSPKKRFVIVLPPVPHFP